MKMLNLDDVKVLMASGSGLGSWLTELDVILKIAISVATLVYIILKCKQLLKENKEK
tara:strand:+ start:27 stop:197 length:171 start_codon:yes stop_codon:yes gene_type:complete